MPPIPSVVHDAPAFSCTQLAGFFHDNQNVRFYHVVALNVPPDIVQWAVNATHEAETTGTIIKSSAAYFVWLLRQWGIENYGDPYPWRTYRRNLLSELPMMSI